MARAVRVLALLCLVGCLAEKTEAKEPQDLLPWLGRLQETQQSIRQQRLVKMLYELMNYKSENAITDQEERGTEEQEKGRRGLDDKVQNRGAGCKFFFWKSWTSC